MKSIEKPISECTASELRKFAIESQGLEVSQSANRPQILAKLSSVGFNIEEGVITVMIDEKAQHPALEHEDDENYVTVIISATEEVGGKEPVWLSVNGRGLWVERAKPQRIHKKYEHVLSNAVRIVYDQKVENGIPGEIKGREVYSYPYTVIPNVKVA